MKDDFDVAVYSAVLCFLGALSLSLWLIYELWR